MTQYKVLIPIVEQGYNIELSGEEKLWEVYCRPANELEIKEAVNLKKDGEKPSIAPLKDVQHYNSSIRPYIAVERLLAAEAINIKSPEQALENWRIFSGDGGDWVSQIEGNSSNLGIALCLLMSCKHSNSRLIAATGALGDSQDSQDLQNSVVEPVADVDIKLRLLLEKKQQNKLPEALKLIFTPHHQIVWQGELKVLESVIKLPEVEQLEKLGLTVHPVATLSEAAKVLGIDIENQLRWFDRWRKLKQILRWLGAALLALAVLQGVYLGFSLSQPLNVSFESRQKNLAADRPFVVCRTATGQIHHYAPIGADHIVPTNAEIGWLLRVGETAEASSWSYRIARYFTYSGLKTTMVLLGEETGVQSDNNSVMEPDNKNRLLSPGDLWSYSWKLDKYEEDILLALLVNRGQALSIEQLKNSFKDKKYRLASKYADEPEKLDLAAIEEDLRNKANGSATFIFKAKNGARNCEQNQL